MYAKTFYRRNLQIFVLSLSACPWQAFPALPANIRIGWKGLLGTNTLAYCKNLQILAVKSFIVQAPGGPVINIIKHSVGVNYTEPGRILK